MTTARLTPPACDACGEPHTPANPVRAGRLLMARFDSPSGRPVEYRAPGHACAECCADDPRLLLARPLPGGPLLPGGRPGARTD